MRNFASSSPFPGAGARLATELGAAPNFPVGHNPLRTNPLHLRISRWKLSRSSPCASLLAFFTGWCTIRLRLAFASNTSPSIIQTYFIPNRQHFWLLVGAFSPRGGLAFFWEFFS